MLYLVINLLAVGFGFIDAGVKAFFDWNQLPSFVQGWSWHISMFALYMAFVWLVGFIRRFTWSQWLGATMLWINEDLTFYLIKSIAHCKVYWNNWLFGSFWQYVLIVLAMNIVSVLLLTYKKGGDV